MRFRFRPLLPAALIAAAAVVSPAGVLATSDPEVQTEEEVIGLDEWRAMTEGRTVWYSLRGRHWGKEHFHRGRDEATFMTPQGECMTAPWMHNDGVFCFAYGGLHCFRHVRRDGELFAIPTAGGEEQRIVRIDDTPLSCEAPLSS
ncbi:MAG: hypothetical protein EA355_14705 [Rhodobacteraceae bacterium]|nr:MAG: hypothetical protein EA355_14705 [Paracoccaceae bacterium]